MLEGPIPAAETALKKVAWAHLSFTTIARSLKLPAYTIIIMAIISPSHSSPRSSNPVTSIRYWQHRFDTRNIISPPTTGWAHHQRHGSLWGAQTQKTELNTVTHVNSITNVTNIIPSVVKVNEAFAPVPIAFMKALKGDYRWTPGHWPSFMTLPTHPVVDCHEMPMIFVCLDVYTGHAYWCSMSDSVTHTIILCLCLSVS